ncbi:unnamed protein product [Cuscuta campestris]|uniref:Pentacotripeptide-repeat region of PRORP domain-containing protein n=1 Tax=Cuscuta campestris TaxID=132261 RepID=A0A484MSR0_9ASTE|nr:unnamed protein product [Cuscuta campestris]
MQMPTSLRAPAWVSDRSLLDRKFSDLHKCRDVNHLKQLHAIVYRFNLHQDPFVATKLVAAFSLCSHIELAVRIFSQVEKPSVHLYNAAIKACAVDSRPSEAYYVFSQMQCRGVPPDNLTYSYLLKLCLDESWLNTVRTIHALFEKKRFDSDPILCNSLIDAYSRCGICSAKRLFWGMDHRDVVSWNSMIGGFLKAGDLSEARKLFDVMPERDTVSWNTMLDGCVKGGQMTLAYELFDKMPCRDVVSWSTMISGYCKAGDLEMARAYFDKMPSKNAITWTIMITGYAEMGLVKEAVELYTQLEKSSLSLDPRVFVSILAACADSRMLGLGKKVHRSIKRSCFNNTNSNTRVRNALIDMYAKCGSLSKALIVFNKTIKKDLVSWNSMIHGLAIHGHGKKALELFSVMKSEGFVPNEVTFVALLSACSHASLVDEGVSIFNSLRSRYGVVPQVQHFGCMIDLLGRGGHLKDAFALALNMPMEANIIIWHSLLEACQMHDDVLFPPHVREYLAELGRGVTSDARLAIDIGLEKPCGVGSIELMESDHPKSGRIYHQMIYGLSQHLRLLAPSNKKEFKKEFYKKF